MKLLTNYIIALTNLYGLVSPKKVLEIYNGQNDQQISKEEIENYSHKPPEELVKNHIFVEFGLFAHAAVLASGEPIDEIHESRKSLPYYVPGKNELLNYVDEYYFEKNEYYKQLFNFFTEKIFHGDRGTAEKMSTEVHDHLSMDSSDISGIINRLANLGVSLEDEEKVEELIHLISEYSPNIRSWENNGYSLIEMNELLRQKSGKQKNKESENLSHLEKYIIALTNLYGRVTKEKVAEIYNLQNDDQVTLDEIEKYLENPPEVLAEHLVFVEHADFIWEDLAIFEEEYHKLVKRQKGKPYYIPEQDQLFMYLDHLYVDYPKGFENLVDYLYTNICKNDYDNAYMRAQDILLTLSMGDGLDGAFFEITKHGYTFESQAEINNLADKITQLNNNTRMRENHGLTPNELRKIEKEKRGKIKNIGRNDPCHCGSGKKYKKCCLKKDRLKRK